ncbi:MAG: PaaI family thioesterase [Deltaproteobacteria bacterium]|nr:PaaI family thioesterase [Deltaproteobacteria bacterium]
MFFMDQSSLQEKYAPKSICFGCGPANTKGLRIRSIPQDDKVVATWKPEPHHQAFPGVLNGGIVGALLDCHSNWTAAWHLMNVNTATAPRASRGQEPEPPCTVTAEYSIKLLRPTPVDVPLELEAWVVEENAATKSGATNVDRVTIEAKLTANGKICATCRGVFVAVKPDHPAYHRW